MNETLNVPVEPLASGDYKPSRTDLLRYHDIHIEFLSLGCVIRIGCKKIPFSTIQEGMKALSDYVANPIESTEIWNERFAKEEEL